MSEPVEPAPGEDSSLPADPPAEEGTAPTAVPAKRRGVRRLVSGRRSRWIVGALGGVIVVAATAGVTAAVVRHGDEGVVRAVSVGPGGIAGLKRTVIEGQDGSRAFVVKGGKIAVAPGAVGAAGAVAVPGDPTTDLGRTLPGMAGTGLAPAPLPSLPAGQAADKAAAAVPGGKVESLQIATEQGGGTAWQATVVGTDGVRHLVTVDGSSGTVTGNTVIG